MAMEHVETTHCISLSSRVRVIVSCITIGTSADPHAAGPVPLAAAAAAICNGTYACLPVACKEAWRDVLVVIVVVAAAVAHMAKLGVGEAGAVEQ